MYTRLHVNNNLSEINLQRHHLFSEGIAAQTLAVCVSHVATDDESLGIGESVSTDERVGAICPHLDCTI